MWKGMGIVVGKQRKSWLYRRKGMNPRVGLEESSKHESRFCRRKGTNANPG
jgi:hypothetical protein